MAQFIVYVCAACGKRAEAPFEEVAAPRRPAGVLCAPCLESLFAGPVRSSD